MTPTIQTCPHCGAPLAISRFAAIVVCSFCESTVRVDPSAVSAKRYRDAWAEWNSPPAEDVHRFSVAGTHWIAGRLLARGEISDVYAARRARWPAELALFKVVREAGDAPLLEQEWRVLQRLHTAAAAKNVDLGARVPSPVVKGVLEDGNLGCAYRWAGGFRHTLEMVRDAYPGGVEPVVSIWVWRRILEVLAVLRQEGLVHGAILPNHLLIENGEHGVRIAGFSCADAPDAPLRILIPQFEALYPASVRDSHKLTAATDVVMSARCVSYLLGGDGRNVPDRVPSRLAELVHRVGADDGGDVAPWALHKEVGELGKSLFGPPAFHPIAMT